MYKTISYSIADTKKFAYLVLDEVFKNNSIQNGAVVLILKGDLGAGKTAFTKCIGEILQIKEEITSPTFTIEKRYLIPNQDYGVDTLIHIDAFRLESGNEILSLDFKNDLKNPKNLICFEWPEMVQDVDILPSTASIIEFEFVDENTRKMYFNPPQEVSLS